MKNDNSIVYKNNSWSIYNNKSNAFSNKKKSRVEYLTLLGKGKLCEDINSENVDKENEITDMYIYTGKGVEKVSINTTIKEKKNEAHKNNRYKYLKEKITNVVKNQEKLKKNIEENNITNFQVNDTNDVFIFDKSKNIIRNLGTNEANKIEGNDNLKNNTKENSSEISYLKKGQITNKLNKEIDSKLNYQINIKENNKVCNQEISQINMQLNYLKNNHQNNEKNNEINKQIVNQVHYQKDYQIINPIPYKNNQIINQQTVQISKQLIHQKNNKMYNNINTENNKINIINYKKNEKINNINNEMNILHNQFINLSNKINIINNKKNGKINNINNKINILNNKKNDQTNNINSQINNINNQIFILSNERINKMYRQICDHTNNLNNQVNNKFSNKIINHLNNLINTQINNIRSNINNLNDQINNHTYIQKSSHMFNQINNQINNLSNQIDNQINSLINETINQTIYENKNKCIDINEIKNDKNKFLKIKNMENINNAYLNNECSPLNLNGNKINFSDNEENKYIFNEKLKDVSKNNENIHFKNFAYTDNENTTSLDEHSSITDTYYRSTKKIIKKHHDERENNTRINHENKKIEEGKKYKCEYYIKQNKLKNKYININESSHLKYNNKSSKNNRENYEKYCKNYKVNDKRYLSNSEQENDNINRESIYLEERKNKDDKNESENESESEDMNESENENESEIKSDDKYESESGDNNENECENVSESDNENKEKKEEDEDEEDDEYKDKIEGSEENIINKGEDSLYNDKKLIYLKNKLIQFNKLKLKQKLKNIEDKVNEHTTENNENEEKMNLKKEEAYLQKKKSSTYSYNNIKTFGNMKIVKDFDNNCDNKSQLKNTSNNENNEKCNFFFEKGNEVSLDKKMERYDFVEKNIFENSKNNKELFNNDFIENDDDKTMSRKKHNIKNNDFLTIFQKLTHNTSEIDFYKEHNINNYVYKRKMNEDFHLSKKLHLFDGENKKEDEEQKKLEELKDSFFLNNDVKEMYSLKEYNHNNKPIMENSTVDNNIYKESSNMYLNKNEKEKENCGNIVDLASTNSFTIDKIYNYTVFYYNKIKEDKNKLDECDNSLKKKLKDNDDYNKLSIKENLKNKYNFLKVKKEVLKNT